MTSTTALTAFTHWQVEEQEGILRLCLDKKDSSTNTLDKAVIEEFGQLVAHIEQRSPKPRAVLLQSAKSNGFIAGADIEAIRDYGDAASLKSNITQAKAIFDRFAALPLVKIALIDGFCLGGGLELALCCDYRFITERSVLGLPEIKLGVIPGFGGTARLSRLLPAWQALPLMLQGKNVYGKKAVALGLADKCLRQSKDLLPAAQAFLQNKPALSKQQHISYTLFQFAPLRRLLANVITKQLRQKVRPEHYPAPFALLDLWQHSGGDVAQMQAAETDTFIRLRETSQSESLIRLYFLQERLKAFGKNAQADIRHLHVIGAGTMGADIAAWAALQGIYTSLADLSAEALDKAAARAQKLFKKKAHGADKQALAAMCLRLDDCAWGESRADIVIEAAVEKLAAKQQIFQHLEQISGSNTLLATNTSSLALGEIGQTLAAPQRLIGIHFFNPVAQMPLVEVVHQANTPPELLERAAKFVTALKKLPLPVKSSPGFLVNRILLPYLYEALLLYREGQPAAVIDAAALQFGMPMGPIELADNVGLDVCAHILTSMGHLLGATDAPLEVAEITNRVQAGKLGKKSGEGFYAYQDGKALKDAVSTDSATLAAISERLMLAYLNACAWCLREEIVADADLLDAGCVFGTGFAPFLGGPMHYAKQRGIANLIAALEQLAAAHGQRFRPDPYWQGLLETNA